MKFIPNFVIIISFIVSLFAQITLHAFPVYGAVLCLKKGNTTHIVRLVGFQHSSLKRDYKNESEGMLNMIPYLNTYLIKQAPEVLVVERGSIPKGEKPNPLDGFEGRLISIAEKNNGDLECDYPLYSDEFNICERPHIPVIAYDIRSQYEFSEFESFRGLIYDFIAHYYNLSLEELLKIQQNNEKYSFFLSLMKSKLDEIIDFEDDEFSSIISHYFQKISNACKLTAEVETHVSMMIQNFNSVHDKTIEEKKLEEMQVLVQRSLISCTGEFADFSFLLHVAKSKYSKQNITLFTGALHSRYLVNQLESIGYKKLLFNPGFFDTLSKEVCEKLFTCNLENIDAIAIKSKL